MTDRTWGLAGIGRLGKAFMVRCDAEGLALSVYHPDRDRGEQAVDGTIHQAVSLSELAETDIVILALPSGAMSDFLNGLSEAAGDEVPTLINTSTKDLTDRLKTDWPAFAFMGVKLAGHARAVQEEGGALFVSDAWSTDRGVRTFFDRLGTTHTGTENGTASFNRLVTEAAVTAAARLEASLEEEGFGEEYRKSALLHMVPQIVKAYEADELGAFADAIRREIKEN